jgi:hypothetical protein
VSSVESDEYVSCLTLLVDSEAVSDTVMISEKIKKSNDALESMDDKSGILKSASGSNFPPVDAAGKGTLSRMSKILEPSGLNGGGSSNTLGGDDLLKKGVFLNDLGPLEQLVVRQLSSLKLQSMMEKFLSYEEIAEMTEPEKQGVWGKFLGAFKPGKKSTVKGIAICLILRGYLWRPP